MNLSLSALPWRGCQKKHNKTNLQKNCSTTLTKCTRPIKTIFGKYIVYDQFAKKTPHMQVSV